MVLTQVAQAEVACGLPNLMPTSPTVLCGKGTGAFGCLPEEAHFPQLPTLGAGSS